LESVVFIKPADCGYLVVALAIKFCSPFRGKEARKKGGPWKEKKEI
jgi:hypothetical protein